MERLRQATMPTTGRLPPVSSTRVANPDLGQAGVAPGAKILPIKILGSRGEDSTANFVAGIIYAVDHCAKVINISASGVSNSESLADAVQ
jgi:subtilisin family serine protease